MAAIGIAAAGAALGSAMFPGVVALGLTGGQIGWMLGSAVGGALFSETSKSYGPRLSDLRTIGSSYGTAIPYVAGHPRISGQIVWASDRRETAHTESQGGKGGTPKQEYTTYTYDLDLLILLTDNEIAGISKIWVGGELVFNNSSTSGFTSITSSHSTNVWARATAYTGSSTQLPDPIYEAAVGVNNACAYRGRGSIFIQGLQLGNTGAIPNLTFEVVSNGTLSTIGFNYDESGDFLFTKESPNLPIKETSITYSGNSSAKFPIGSGGMLCNSSSTPTFSSLSATLLDLKTYDFTIEFFYYITEESTSYNPIIKFNTTTSSISIGPTTQNYVKFTGGLPGSPELSTTNKSKINAWNHCVLERKDNLLILTLNDVSTTLPWYDTFLELSGVNESITSIEIGKNLNILCYLDSLRVSQVARYYPYTVTPTLPFLRDAYSTFIVNYEDYNILQALEPSVQSVVSTICNRAGIPSNLIDTTGIASIPNNVRGMAISQVTTARNTLDMLSNAFNFDCYCYDKLYFTTRAKELNAYIPYQDLGMEVVDSILNIVKVNDMEIPSAISLTYLDVNDNYQNATQVTSRSDIGQENSSNITVPLALNSSEAKAITNTLLMHKVASSYTAEVVVGSKYLNLQPTDIIGIIDTNDNIAIMQIRKIQETSNSLTKLYLSSYDASIYSQTGVTTEDINEGDVTPPAYAKFEILDIPPLNDLDVGSIGYYVAVDGNYTNKWKGSYYYDSYKADESYTFRKFIGSQTVIGKCLSALGNFTDGNIFDEYNTLDVYTETGELSSVTRDAILQNYSVNAALVGNEILQFRNAELIGNNTYRLSGFIRGKKGTHWAISTHTVNDRFVLLNYNGLKFINKDFSDVTKTLYTKVVAAGRKITEISNKSFTFNSYVSSGNPVIDIRANRSTANTTITWKSISQKDTRIVGISPVVYSNSTISGYKVEVYNSDYSILKRTILVTTPATTCTYSNADQITDFGSSQSILYLKIYEKNTTGIYGVPTSAII